MSSNQSNYRSIFKATAILGSVQLFTIIIGIIRNKIVSILLGPAGMGIVGLFQSTISTITGFSNCGLTSSALKNISLAYEQQDMTNLGKVVFVIKRLLWTTGLLGAVICLIMSKQLSIWTFGSDEFTYSYCWLSIALILKQLTDGNYMIIKCCRQIRMFAKANVIGNFLSLFITVPLYYIWGVNAIVPVFIFLGLSTFLVSFYYERRLNIKEEKVQKVEFKEISLDIFKIGIAVAFAGVLPDCLAYYLRIFISSRGGIADVGLYTAGFTILNTYVGMIYTSMSTDYIPRLSAVVNDNSACQDVMNRQVRIASMLLLPILTLFIVFSKILVAILYTEQFYPMVGMMMWGAVGCFLQSTDWIMGNLFVPKRDTKVYLCMNWITATFIIISNLSCYLLWGLTGLGISLIFIHLFGIITCSIYMRWRYNIRYEKDMIQINSYGFAFFLFLLFVNRTEFLPNYLVLITNTILIITVCLYSYKKLNIYMDFNSFIRSKIKKQKH